MLNKEERALVSELPLWKVMRSVQLETTLEAYIDKCIIIFGIKRLSNWDYQAFKRWYSLGISAQRVVFYNSLCEGKIPRSRRIRYLDVCFDKCAEDHLKSRIRDAEILESRKKAYKEREDTKC